MGFIEPGKPLKRRKLRQTIPVKNVKYTPNKNSILERLPHELLYRIFVFTGVRENHLPLTNKYFNNLLTLENGPKDDFYWPGKKLLLDIVKIHFTYDLNQNLNIPSVRKRIGYYKSKLPNGEQNEHINELNDALVVFEKIPSALVTDLFSYKFISAEFLDLLYFKDSHALEKSVILEEITERPKFIKRHLKSLMKECKSLNLNLAKDESEDECDNMARIADEAFNANTDDTHILSITPEGEEVKDETKYSYNTHLKTPIFPNKFYDNITQKQLRFMSKMSHFGFTIENKDKFIINSIQSFDKIDWEIANWKPSFDILLGLTNLEINAGAVIEGFQMILHCRAQHKNYYYSMTYLLLEIFYRRLREHNGLEDTSLWHYIVHTKDHSFLDMIMQFAGTPNNEILALMNT